MITHRLIGGLRALFDEAAPSAPLPSVSVVLVWNCGALALPFLVMGEIRGGALHLLRNQPATFGDSGAGGPAPAALGTFAINLDQWRGCPHCGVKHNLKGPYGFWRCPCGTFNCAGDRGGRYRCACGNVFTTNSFAAAAETFEVSGLRQVATTPPPPLPGVIASPPPLPAPPRASSSRQLPPGPPLLRLPGKRSE
jgi:hypothetical protein